MEELKAALKRDAASTASPGAPTVPTQSGAPLLAAAGVVGLGLFGAVAVVVTRTGPAVTISQPASAHAVPVTPTPPPNVDAQESRERGAKALKEGHWDVAHAAFDNAIHLQPVAQDYVGRAAARFQLKDFGGAIQDCNAAIELEPDSGKAYLSRGVARGKLGDLKREIEDCSEAIRLSPDDGEAYFFRGFARAELGDHPGAIDDWERALQLQPDAVWAEGARQGIQSARQVLAEERGGGGLPGEAVAAQAARERGNLALSEGRWDDAKRAFGELVRLQPDDHRGFAGRGVARLRLRDWEGAIEDCTVAIRLKPDFELALLSRAFAYERLEDWEGVVEDCSRALQFRPDYAEALHSRGRARDKLGHLKDAVEDMERALKLAATPGLADRVRQHLRVFREKLAEQGAGGASPAGAEAAERARERARLAEKSRRLGVAHADLDEAIRLAPDDAQTWVDRANVRLQLRDWPGAVEDCGEALRLDPELAKAYFLRAYARRRLDDAEGEIADLSELIRLKPDHAGARYSRGLARAKLGGLEGAIEDWERVLELEPDVSTFPEVRQRLQGARLALAEREAAEGQ
jgi:tetratricopeptide (TPR) repeat protein